MQRKKISKIPVPALTPIQKGGILSIWGEVEQFPHKQGWVSAQKVWQQWQW